MTLAPASGTAPGLPGLRGLAKLRSGFPLLVKDLTELAARGRTYVIRGIYAVGLFAVFALVFYDATARLGGSPAFHLGVGRDLLGYMFVAQLVGIYVFLPAMVSGAITEEKEKRTLELLFVTDLTPGEIVLQKLGGRLVPMLTLLLLSLPLMAVCYSLGGLSAREVTLSAAVLVTTCVQVGAFSIMVSAYCRTSSEALLATYGYAVLVFMATWVVAGTATFILGVFMVAARSEIGLLIAAVPAVLATGLTPFVAMGTVGMGWGGSAFAFGVIVAAWGWSVVFVVRARRYLVERAFLQPKPRKQTFFGAMVRYARRDAARKRKQGLDDTSYLPGDEPVLWRETTGTYLDWPHGFRGTLGFIMFPIAYVALLAALVGRTGGDSSWMTFLVHVMWAMGAVAVAVRSSRAFALERANQTLEVLLSTPLSGSEIVREKMRASRRLAVLFGVPLLTLSVIEAWLEIGRYSFLEALEAILYLAGTTLSVFVFLPAFAWVSLLAGLWMRDARRATFLALGAVFAWNAGPVVLSATAAWLVGGFEPERFYYLSAPSPAFVVALLEDSRGGPFGAVGGRLVAVAGLALNAAVLVAARGLCLRNADRYLGRCSLPGAGADEAAPSLPVAGGAA